MSKPTAQNPTYVAAAAGALAAGTAVLAVAFAPYVFALWLAFQ